MLVNSITKNSGFVVLKDDGSPLSCFEKPTAHVIMF